MLHLLETLQGLAPNPLGGRIRRDFLWVLRLQLLKAAEKAVVFIVGHCRVVQHIVAVAGCAEDLPQFLHFAFVIHSSLLFWLSSFFL